MPSPAYNSLLKIVSSYVDAQKAAEVISRQLTACKLTADAITTAEIKSNSSRFNTACGLYISDTAKREELKSKIAAM
jgi:hypothetical protein